MADVLIGGFLQLAPGLYPYSLATDLMNLADASLPAAVERYADPFKFLVEYQLVEEVEAQPLQQRRHNLHVLIVRARLPVQPQLLLRLAVVVNGNGTIRISFGT